MFKFDNYKKIQLHEKSSKFSRHVEIYDVQTFQDFEKLCMELQNIVYLLIISGLEKEHPILHQDHEKCATARPFEIRISKISKSIYSNFPRISEATFSYRSEVLS